MFFRRIDDSHCHRIHSSLTAVHCFDVDYVGKEPVAWKEYYAEYLLKERQESIDRCTGLRDITGILLKMALNTIQSVNPKVIILQVVNVDTAQLTLSQTSPGFYVSTGQVF